MEGASKAVRPPLGNNAKCTTPPSEAECVEQIQGNRRERYNLQSIARLLFGREGHREGLAHPFDYHRTAKCLHVRMALKVDVYKDSQHRKAFYGGLITCGSVWACPVCTAKVQERRRLEIAKAMNRAYAEGMKCVMVTTTFPHMAFQKLPDLIERQAVALSKMKSGNPWTRVRQWAGYHGQIRSLELTHGASGWHPHTHEIWIVRKDCDAAELRERILNRWQSACERAGLLEPAKVEAFREHAIDVKDNASCSDYLAKMDDSKHWGADREVAKASSKKGKAKGLHPFQFLARYKEGDEAAGRLWIEYANAMKGKRQLFWSRGLKDWAELDDKTDEELAAEQNEEAALLGRLDKDQWSLVLRYDARSLILDIGEEAGWQGIILWLEAKRKQREAEAKSLAAAPSGETPKPSPDAVTLPDLPEQPWCSPAPKSDQPQVLQCAHPSSLEPSLRSP